MPAAVTYQRETFAHAWPDIEPLTGVHWQEVAFAGAKAPDIDQSIYRDACQAGRLVTLTARAEDTSALLGYALFWVGPIPQHAGELGAWQDALYVAPDARKSGVGSGLLRYCERTLAGIGIHVVHQYARKAHDFGPVLERMGYVAAETIYAKRVA